MPFDDIKSPDGNNINDIKEMHYKTFRETYKVITLAMGIGMIYPNPETARRRLICIFIMILTIAPITSLLLLDMYKSWLRHEITEIVRHCTLIVPVVFIFIKMFILYYKRDTAKEIIDQIDNDYATYNHLPPSYKAIVTSHLQDNVLYNEKYWTFLVLFCVLSFPGISVIQNIYNFLFKDEPTKYMIHDVTNPNAPPEERFDSPFFELIFIYTCYGAIFYIVNFTGFDGFFGLVINHACLKMDLYCQEFADAMKAKDKEEIHKRLVGVIESQNRMIQYVDLIKETFNVWLGSILVATMIQICNLMFQITEGAELDPRYIIFIAGTIIHVYLPCRYSSKLKHMSMETSTTMYCGGWERMYDVGMRRTVLIMIMRAQSPLEITAFNLLVFDMELFVFILKTSYSMYTLLCS